MLSTHQMANTGLNSEEYFKMLAHFRLLPHLATRAMAAKIDFRSVYIGPV